MSGPAAESPAPTLGHAPARLGPRLVLLVLLVAILPRLLYVGNPIAGWHAWRQADTAAIARNFHRDGMRILYPAVDWSGAGPGYVESEFPAFPFLAAILYRMFGPDVVWGRLLALLFAAVAALYLARLASAYVDRWSAVLAACALSLFPIHTYFGVAFMPESLMLLASVAALYHLDRWSRVGSERDRWVSCAFLALAIAVKLPALFLGIPVAHLTWRRLGWRMLTDPAVWAYATAALVPPGLWYLHAHGLWKLTGLTFGIWEAGAGKWANLDLLVSPSFYFALFAGKLVERHLTYAGFVLLVIGVLVLRRKTDTAGFRWWALGGLVYLLVVAKGNAVHDYYQLPVLLPLSLWVGAGIAWLIGPGAGRARRITGGVLLAAFLALSLFRASQLHRRATNWGHLRDIAAVVSDVVPPGDRIIVVGGGNPTMLYHADRRGWNPGVEKLTQAWIDERRGEGATHLLIPAGPAGGPAADRVRSMLLASYADRSTRKGVHLFELSGSAAGARSGPERRN